MTNLVNLQFDKDTGRLFARPGSGSGTGGSSSGVATGFLHQQITGNTTWAIAHNGNTTNILVQVYDASGSFILPNSIDIIDANNVSITFSTVQTGSGHILFFEV